MSMPQASHQDATLFNRLVPELPLVMWMVLLSLALGLSGGMDAAELVVTYNAGFGRALGEFALILLPSFVLAAALAKNNIASEAAGRTAAFASPIAGAGMICPDTAYAALSPAAGRYKLETAFGAYTGFKLLYPAGPLIVAAGLGGVVMEQTQPISLLLFGLLLAVPAWASAVICVRLFGDRPHRETAFSDTLRSSHVWMAFAPFMLMAAMILMGGLVGETGSGLLDFMLLPKGALLSAAILALVQTPPEMRRDCLDAAVRRTGALLLIIGAAGAFGAVSNTLVAFDQFVPEGQGVMTLVALFVLTVAFKLAQGSSMATFAAIAPVAAPIVIAGGAEPILAVFAICLGSFVAILPNDSYYWLVRGDAFHSDLKEALVVRRLAGVTVVQASVGMAVLMGLAVFWG